MEQLSQHVQRVEKRVPAAQEGGVPAVGPPPPAAPPPARVRLPRVLIRHAQPHGQHFPPPHRPCPRFKLHLRQVCDRHPVRVAQRKLEGGHGVAKVPPGAGEDAVNHAIQGGSGQGGPHGGGDLHRGRGARAVQHRFQRFSHPRVWHGQHLDQEGGRVLHHRASQQAHQGWFRGRVAHGFPF